MPHGSSCVASSSSNFFDETRKTFPASTYRLYDSFKKDSTRSWLRPSSQPIPKTSKCEQPDTNRKTSKRATTSNMVLRRGCFAQVRQLKCYRTDISYDNPIHASPTLIQIFDANSTLIQIMLTTNCANRAFGSLSTWNVLTQGFTDPEIVARRYAERRPCAKIMPLEAQILTTNVLRSAH